MVEPSIRAVVFKEGDWWIIQGLDYDFATVARSLLDVPAEIQRWLTVLFAVSHQIGVEPFHGYSRAPRRFWKMYEQAKPWPSWFLRSSCQRIWAPHPSSTRVSLPDAS